MQTLKRIKKYKDVSPEETVNKIKKLLDQYGIEITEEFYHIDTADINSCRIFISNKEVADLDIGTNGKGMNKNYTRASAYGEFMERLENNMLLPSVITNKENIVVMEEKSARPYYKKYFEEVFGENEQVSKVVEQKYKGVELQEFEDVFNNIKTYLPTDFVFPLCSSNGMCAGNGKEEAVLQGISEIFERYVLYEIFMNNLTPPEIDRKYFAGEQVIERLDELEKEGYKYRILDYSLGKGYPVIGLELTYKNKCRIRNGSDPSPVTALERCFTEIFQGYNSIRDDHFIDYEETLKEKDSFEGSEKIFWFNQFLQEILNGTGAYPEGCVKKDRKPSYEFTGFEHPVSYSNEDDLNYYYDVIKRNNKHLYISDMSNMGFPAYYIVIPSISENIIKDDGSYYAGKLSNMVYSREITNIPFMKKEELLNLAQRLENFYINYAGYKQNISNYFPPGKFTTYHKYKMLAFLYACAGEKEKADKYLEKFFETPIGMYEPQLLNRRLVQEGKLEDCFPLDEWPICPRCDECKASSKCRLKAVKLLNEHIMANIPQQ